ncbi:MAG: hypothetical protein AAGD18_12315 [Actinomycetota bacterium]
MSVPTTGTVDLADGASATEHLHRALVEAQRRFDELDAVDLGTLDRFRSSYPDVVPAFEAARLGSARRTEIAAALREGASAAMAWTWDGGERPLADHLAAGGEPLDVTAVDLPGDGLLRPAVPFGGELLSGTALADVVGALVERGSATRPVGDAIVQLLRRAGEDGIDLGGERIVILGASAELAPTMLWLAGGADVLWLDVVDPPAELLHDESLSGRLSWVPGGVDLLTAPERAHATVERFADGAAVDLGLYAYAGGRAREWRLTGTMNAIVEALPPELVRSASMLVSPTTCGALSPPELAGEERRRRDRPRWQAVMERLRLLGHGPGHAVSGAARTNRAVVSIQGTSYQAAQYLGKIIAAEAWATGPDALTVSANTAGISRTESLQHPVFDLAFSGASAFGVETFEPSTTAHLNGLLVLHDRLDPPTSLDVDTLFATRVHGGISEVPYPIEPALRIAAAIGLARNPGRLPTLLRRR